MSEHLGNFKNFRIGAIAASAAAAALFMPAAEAFDVRVEGLSGEPKANVEAMLTPVRERTSTQQRQTYRAQVDKSIRRGLEALGYYQYEIRYRWEKPKKDNPEQQSAFQKDKHSEQKRTIETLNLADVSLEKCQIAHPSCTLRGVL